MLNAKGISSWFDCCMTACEAGAGKPAPDIYLKVAERLETKPENCLVFEDTYAGAMADRGQGCLFVRWQIPILKQSVKISWGLPTTISKALTRCLTEAS